MVNLWEEYSSLVNNTMGCPTTPLSCLNPVNIFAGVYNPHCGGFADPSNFQAEQAIVNSQFQELINNYGVELNYYVNGFNINEMNMLYGEHPTQEYSGPFILKSYIELEEGVSLSQYGMNSEDTLTAYIHIKDFTNKFINYLASEDNKILFNEMGQPLTVETIALQFFTKNGQRIEPKSDDLLEITALGCDRPGDRGPKIFRITEALDQSVQDGLNPMMGHYIWRLRAVRYETSHETNAPQEQGNAQVYDNTFSGKLSSALFSSLSTNGKLYNDNVDTLSINTVYDMDNTDNNIYGEYY
jgi:hypothetical protein